MKKINKKIEAAAKVVKFVQDQYDRLEQERKNDADDEFTDSETTTTPVTFYFYRRGLDNPTAWTIPFLYGQQFDANEQDFIIQSIEKAMDEGIMEIVDEAGKCSRIINMHYIDAVEWK